VGEAKGSADIHVINTCTVTARADHKARALIRRIARENPGQPLLVTGCSAQTEAHALSALSDTVVVVPQSQKSRLLDVPSLVADALRAGRAPLEELRSIFAVESTSEPFAFVAEDTPFHTRAFLKIQDGCDCACAYCRVPLARGPSVSLALEDVLRRAADLEAVGRREIVLTGVNLSAWRAEGLGLPDLLRGLLGSSRHVRFRMSSIEPEALTPGLMEVLAQPRVCPHAHVPVQSGSDSVLRRMRRRYLSAGVVQGVRLLRTAWDDPFLAADLIVGFPGETEEDFQKTVTLVQELGFAALHVFPFSPRPGTAAVAFTPVVPERVRRERAHRLGELSRRQGSAYAQRWLGREVAVLLEGRGRGSCRGVSQNYLKVDVLEAPAEGVDSGRIVRAIITEAGPPVRARFLAFDD
jgi:threonylcarbamoyladenosine tRNA methylthiotransferase MtaB